MQTICAGRTISGSRRFASASIASWSRAAVPVGAYDLVDRLSSEKKRLAPVTIYRALDFLRDAGLVHRLATQNSYVISHGQPDVNAMKIMFVDSKTGETIEVHSTEVAEAVRKAAEQAGFRSVSPFMEVEGEIAH